MFNLNMVDTYAKTIHTSVSSTTEALREHYHLKWSDLIDLGLLRFEVLKKKFPHLTDSELKNRIKMILERYK